MPARFCTIEFDQGLAVSESGNFCHESLVGCHYKRLDHGQCRGLLFKILTLLSRMLQIVE